ncbi:MAG: DUF1905 domain-containing protein [Bilifractor sp.]|jgi:uncharacterized protein YdhG (YjbR/CyaY superfamily)
MEKQDTGIDEYIASQDPSIRPQLNQVREAIRSQLPFAVEKISWGMPTWWDRHNLIHFAPAKKHIGIYPGPEAVNAFSDRLDELGYSHDKGTIRIPYSEPLPLDLISEIAAWCGEHYRPDQEKKASASEKGPKRKKDPSGKTFAYDAVIREIPEKGGAYVAFPWNIREVFGKGRVKVHVEFDGIPYDGSIVNMGIKNEDGSVCYIIGVRKAIRMQLQKGEGDTVYVTVKERAD